MSYTLAEATVFYEAAKKAYTAALTSKEYSIKDRQLARQNMEKLLGEMNRWKKVIADINAGKSQKIKVNRFVPLDG